jgi:hypothetical protein
MAAICSRVSPSRLTSNNTSSAGSASAAVVTASDSSAVDTSRLTNLPTRTDQPQRRPIRQGLYRCLSCGDFETLDAIDTVRPPSCCRYSGTLPTRYPSGRHILLDLRLPLSITRVLPVPTRVTVAWKVRAFSCDALGPSPRCRRHLSWNRRGSLVTRRCRDSR